MRPKCQDRTKGGKRCKATPRKGERYCRLHGKSGSERAAAMARRKAEANAPPPVEPLSLKSASDVQGVIEDVAARIRASQLDPQRGYAIASLCRVALEVLQLIPKHGDQEQPGGAPATPAKARPAWAPPDLAIVPDPAQVQA